MPTPASLSRTDGPPADAAIIATTKRIVMHVRAPAAMVHALTSATWKR